MVVRLGIVLTAVALCSACNQTPDPAALRSEIEPLVKKFAQMRQKDISGAVATYSTSVVAASNGEIDRGMDAVRTTLDNALKQGDTYEIAVGSIDVVPLGAAHALSVAPFSLKVTSRLGITQDLNGVSSLVWHRTKEGWRILHEHESYKPLGLGR
jgi:ketosteroid isomerase-like protein